MDEYCMESMARRMLMAEVSGGEVQGKPRLGWMVRKCEGGHLQQKNGVSCLTMRKRSAGVEIPFAYVYQSMIEFHVAIFAWFLCFFGLSLPHWWFIT